VDDLASRLLVAAGIPLRYRSCRLDNFKVSAPEPAVRGQLAAALAECRAYADGFLEARGGVKEWGLLFVGPPGGGKTHLAAAVLMGLIERYRVRGRFVELTSLFRQLQNSFDPGAPVSQREILDPLVEAEVLLLDELGAQNPTPWVQDVLYLIINTRYAERRPTLFTTNYRLDEPAATGRAGPERQGSPAALSQRLSPMLVSRLWEMARPVRLEAVEDYRRELKMHRVRA
jgi:DNA replication protein DnaC